MNTFKLILKQHTKRLIEQNALDIIVYKMSSFRPNVSKKHIYSYTVFYNDLIPPQ